MNGEVVIASAALRSALGAGEAAVAKALLAGEGGPERLHLPDFGGRDYLYHPMADAPPRDRPGRLWLMLEGCVAEAIEASALTDEQLSQAAVFLGSSSFDIGGEELRYRRELVEQRSGALPIPDSYYGDLAAALAHRFALRGGVFTFNTACTSSANALLYATAAVRAGRVPAAVVVGVECFNHTTLYGFDSLQLLARDGYRPFDAARGGLVLGEGIGAVVVTQAEQCSESSQWGDVVIRGGDNGCDPGGMTCASAESMARVVSGALRNSAIAVADISLVKAHATGSEGNDAAEAQAMHLVFGETLPEITVLKGALGHTLGASGIVELIALIACLRRGEVPPTLGFSLVDEALGITPLCAARPFNGGAVMLNYFGFGGNNNSLILSLES